MQIKDLYYSKYEISNIDYHTFLDELKEVDQEAYQKCKIFNERWSVVTFTESEPMARNYHDHPAFEKYPVVNISNYGAKKYCEWRTEKSLKAGIKNIVCRLPTTEEYQSLYKTLSINFKSDNGPDYDKIKTNLKFQQGHAYDGALFPVMAKNPSNKKLDVFKQNEAGMYHLIGYVSEYTQDGLAIGGDWDTYPSNSLGLVEVNEPDPRVGFRLVMEVMSL